MLYRHHFASEVGDEIDVPLLTLDVQAAKRRAASIARLRGVAGEPMCKPRRVSFPMHSLSDVTLDRRCRTKRGALRDQPPGGWAGTFCQPAGQFLTYG